MSESYLTLRVKTRCNYRFLGKTETTDTNNILNNIISITEHFPRTTRQRWWQLNLEKKIKLKAVRLHLKKGEITDAIKN